MKISTALCICLLAAAFTARAGELTPAEAAGLLKQLQEMREKQPDAQADFIEEKTSHLVLKPLISEGTVAFEAPDKLRREVKGSNSSISVSDGKTMWVYYPNFKEAEHYSIGQRSVLNDALSALTAGMNFEHIDEYYNFHAFRDATGYQLQLSPKRPDLKRLLDHMTIWMDNEFLLQKVELFMLKGDHMVTTYKNVRRTPLPASTFEFTPPPDAHVSYPLGK
jgi:outer membrane lipoprotein-sorting protein